MFVLRSVYMFLQQINNNNTAETKKYHNFYMAIVISGGLKT